MEVKKNPKKDLENLRGLFVQAGLVFALVLVIVLIGGIYLVFVCITPEILVTKYSLPLYVGGTGILIMVNVVLDLINQVQSHLFSNKYGANVKKRRVRVRGQGQMR